METILLIIGIICLIGTAGIGAYAARELLDPPHMRRARKRRKEIEKARAERQRTAPAQEPAVKDTTYRWIPPKDSRKEKIERREEPKETPRVDTSYRWTPPRQPKREAQPYREPIYTQQKTYVPKTEKSEYDLLVDDLRESNNWHECYEKKWLFTRNERPQHKKITDWATKRGYIVLAKVRMADLVNVRQDKRWSQGLFRKVSQRHLDFVICKSNLDPIIAIEIQDSSHNNLKAMEADAFKKIVLESCGYKLLQIYDVTDEILDRAISS